MKIAEVLGILASVGVVESNHSTAIAAFKEVKKDLKGLSSLKKPFTLKELEAALQKYDPEIRIKSFEEPQYRVVGSKLGIKLVYSWKARLSVVVEENKTLRKLLYPVVGKYLLSGKDLWSEDDILDSYLF